MMEMNEDGYRTHMAGDTKFEAEHPEYLDYVKARGRFEDHSLTNEEALELMELASMDPDKSAVTWWPTT